MRLLWAQNCFWPDLRGGAETRAYYTVQALADLGHEIDVLCRATTPAIEANGSGPGAAIYRVSRPEIHSRFWRIQPWLRMHQWKGILREFLGGRVYDGAILLQFECVYYLRKYVPGLRIVLATCGTMLGAREHESPPLGCSLNGRIAEWARFRQFLSYEKAAYRAADHIIAESQNVREQLAAYYHVPMGKVTVIRSGVDVTRFCPRLKEREAIRRREGWPTKAFVVIGVGRLDRVKNFEYLVRSVAAATQVDICGVLVGQGEQREHLANLARELGVADRILFMGHRQDVHELLSAADAFLLPSVYEAYGAVWPEALASGLPCLGLRRQFGRINTASDEHIQDGVNGFIVDPDNSADCARRWVELARDTSLRERLGQAARASALSKYDWEATAKAYVDLVRQ